MATITITVEGSTVGTVSITDTLDQENSDRFMAWLVHSYGANPDGSPRLPPEIIAACWSAIRTGMFNNIVSYEREVVAQQARDAVQPVVSTTEVL